MTNEKKFFIDGRWVDPVVSRFLDVVDPSNEEVFASIAVGSAADVDAAVAAARKAFPSFSSTSRDERLALLRAIVAAYEARAEDLVHAVSREMGAPLSLASDMQVPIGLAHLSAMIETLSTYEFEQKRGHYSVLKEPIGVVGMITPWNWPLNQIVCKVAPALAAGCTMVLKPSEIAPLNGIVFAEILEAAGVPPGVFNLVNGDGPTVGERIASHPDVDMVSFTGSTRAGIQVAKCAADTVKRVHQELGGKSANILFPDVDLETAVTQGVAGCFLNSGQSCNAPTRMFVPRHLHDEAAAIAGRAAETYGPEAGTPRNPLGPVISKVQFDKIQGLIQSGLDEGAQLVAGGLGLPAGANHGYHVQPTVFAGVRPNMRIAREEIFGPVLTLLPYDDEAEAVGLANDTPYGLAAYVQTKDATRAEQIARQMRAGTVYINYPAWDAGVPFGGYKQSGNGREYAEFGLDEFLEIKGVVRAAA